MDDIAQVFFDATFGYSANVFNALTYIIQYPLFFVKKFLGFEKIKIVTFYASHPVEIWNILLLEFCDPHNQDRKDDIL